MCYTKHQCRAWRVQLHGYGHWHSVRYSQYSTMYIASPSRPPCAPRSPRWFHDHGTLPCSSQRGRAANRAQAQGIFSGNIPARSCQTGGDAATRDTPFISAPRVSSLPWAMLPWSCPGTVLYSITPLRRRPGRALQFAFCWALSTPEITLLFLSLPFPPSGIVSYTPRYRRREVGNGDGPDPRETRSKQKNTRYKSYFRGMQYNLYFVPSSQYAFYIPLLPESRLLSL